MANFDLHITHSLPSLPQHFVKMVCEVPSSRFVRLRLLMLCVSTFFASSPAILASSLVKIFATVHIDNMVPIWVAYTNIHIILSIKSTNVTFHRLKVCCAIDSRDIFEVEFCVTEFQNNNKILNDVIMNWDTVTHIVNKRIWCAEQRQREACYRIANCC